MLERHSCRKCINMPKIMHMLLNSSTTFSNEDVEMQKMNKPVLKTQLSSTDIDDPNLMPRMCSLT